jgi:hypothetical protein
MSASGSWPPARSYPSTPLSWKIRPRVRPVLPPAPATAAASGLPLIAVGAVATSAVTRLCSTPESADVACSTAAESAGEAMAKTL